jgi:predicted alpha/beta superfamily hydrolase
LETISLGFRSATYIARSMKSRLLGNERDVTIYTPPGYEEKPARPYPVLLLLDGQNVFDPNTAYVQGQHWRAGETADRMIAEGMLRPLVIAAVNHAGPLRVHEYTPTENPRTRQGGGAPRTLQMLAEEILPWLRENFPITESAAETGIAGSSLGGLFALYAALHRPGIFGQVGALSPSLWWHNRILLQQAKQYALASQARIWLDMGTQEGAKPDEGLRDSRRMRDVLVSRGWRAGISLRYEEIQGGMHTEAAWAERLPDLLRFLFPAT